MQVIGMHSLVRSLPFYRINAVVPAVNDRRETAAFRNRFPEQPRDRHPVPVPFAEHFLIGILTVPDNLVFFIGHQHRHRNLSRRFGEQVLNALAGVLCEPLQRLIGPHQHQQRKENHSGRNRKKNAISRRIPIKCGCGQHHKRDQRNAYRNAIEFFMLSHSSPPVSNNPMSKSALHYRPSP